MRCQISSESGTTIKQRAGLSGDPIGEPRICWVNRGELGHLQGHEDDGLNVSDVDLAGYVGGATPSAFDHVTGRVASRGFPHGNDFIGVGAHSG